MKVDIKDVLEEIIDNGIISITVSNKKFADYKYEKVNITRLEEDYQITRYTKTQAFHKNVNEEDLFDELVEIVNNYKQIDGKCEKGNYNVRINKRNNVLKRFTSIKNKPVYKSHDRIKNYILSDYKNIEVLKDLDIITLDNKIAAPMRDKFRQINKYVELVNDLIGQDEISKLKIVDFGADKSYLTFVLYHYLAYTKSIDVEIIGIDLKEDVIKNNNDLAKKYAYKNLSFICGDINDIEISNVDMVISLHACDIATDFALNKALEWQAKYIVAVPCCQNEVYKQIKSNKFDEMIKYGVVKDRISAIITDTVRANVLEYSGYNTQVIEYIDSDHSLKNLMIRARYTNYKDEKALENIINLQKEFNFNQKLLELRNLGVKHV
ncbi:MAG TPA: SAM-dependent methyltransferase [Erysipelotrichaceae bacterium]|nr:SAM-dependent methyltransferase [Erysipelotrichaceae bacterium]